MSHVRKSKLVEVRLREHADRLIENPSSMKGSWRDLLLTPEARLHVDLGCGKGLWLTRAAEALPGDVFIGVDNDRTCVSFAVERVGVAGADNARVVFDSVHNVSDLFAPEEIDVLHVNFPTPFPRKKETAKRVTAAERLMEYRELLAPDGRLQMKNDSQPLFDFTLDQLACAGYDVLCLTRDLHGEAESDDREAGFGDGVDGEAGFIRLGEGAVLPGPFSPEDFILSQYEEKLTAKGARVLALHAARS